MLPISKISPQKHSQEELGVVVWACDPSIQEDPEFASLGYIASPG